MSARRVARGFTLIELLVVLCVILTAMSMIFAYNNRADRRQLQVRADAERLASVLRDVRAMAMDQKSLYGVAFNIANAKGSSGKILNNRDGGHFYRIVGPANNVQQDYRQSGNGYNAPFVLDRPYKLRWGWNDRKDYPLKRVLDEYARDWIGDPIPLTKGQVRFLALADQDNGNLRDHRWRFGPTYPRPWFGEWNATTKRVYAWGGYETDPAPPGSIPTDFKDFDEPPVGQPSTYWRARQGPTGGPVSYTGFYYEGDDGVITGSVNPADRFYYADTNLNGLIDFGDPAANPPVPPDEKTQLLYRKDDSRALVNADWLDAVILFYPDGTARYVDWMQLRHEYASYSRALAWPGPPPPNPNGGYWFFNKFQSQNLNDLAMADRCNQINDADLPSIPYNCRYEASHYKARTGYWYITLAPDVADDRSTFPTAQQALASIFPCWRVGVSGLGEVKVVEVKRSLKPGTVLDDVHKDGWWQIGTPCTGDYANNLLTTATGPAMPVEDAVTTDMLTHRQWWIKPPPSSP